MRYRVFQMDYPEQEPGGVELCVYETDNAAEANRQAQELSVPGNTCWVVDTIPVLRHPSRQETPEEVAAAQAGARAPWEEEDPNPCTDPRGHRYVCNDEDEEIAYCERCGEGEC